MGNFDSIFEQNGIKKPSAPPSLMDDSGSFQDVFDKFRTQSNPAPGTNKFGVDVTSHPYNPLNPNNKINEKGPTTSVVRNLFESGDLLENAAKYTGLKVFEDLGNALIDVNRHPDLTEPLDLPTATKQVGKQIIGGASKVIVDPALGIQQEVTGEDVGPVDTEFGQFQAPQSRARETGSKLLPIAEEAWNALGFVGTFSLLSEGAKSATLKLASAAEAESNVRITHQDMQKIVNADPTADPVKLEAFKKAALNDTSLLQEFRKGYLEVAGTKDTPLSNFLTNAATRPLGEFGNIFQKYGVKINYKTAQLAEDNSKTINLTKQADGTFAQSPKAIEPYSSPETFTSTLSPLKTSQWAILTAENPGGAALTPAENAVRNTALISELKAAGYNPIPVEGHYGGNPENSFIVPGMSNAEALQYGIKHGQESVLTPRGLVYQDGRVNPADLGKISFDGNQQDYYSKITINGKPIKFSIPIDFDTTIAPVQKALPAHNTTGTPELLPNSPDNLHDNLQSHLSDNLEAGFIDPQAIVDSMKIGTKGIQDFLEESRKNSLISANIEDNLYQLKTNNIADQIRARQLLEQSTLTAKEAEELYHYAENKDYPISDELKTEFKREIEPLLKAIEELAHQIKPNIPLRSEDYAPRFVKNKGGILDRMIEGAKNVTGSGKLSTAVGNFKHRTMMAVEDEAGNRTVVSVNGDKLTGWNNNESHDFGDIVENQVMTFEQKAIRDDLIKNSEEVTKLEAEEKILRRSKISEIANSRRLDKIQSLLEEIGMKNHALDLQLKETPQYRLVDATTQEIEANTSVSYHKNILNNALLTYLKLRQVSRAMDFLETFKSSPEFPTIAQKFGEGNSPRGWKPTDLPQFKGYNLEPHVADSLNQFNKSFASGDPLALLTGVNKLLRNAIFFNPLIHIPNIGVHWIVNRGVTPFVDPRQWPKFISTSARAIDAVIHQNQDYIDMLRSGAPLLSGELDNRSLSNLMLEKMANEISEDPGFDKVAKALGYVNPAEWVKAIYKFSSKATWVANDVATMQAIYEEMENGATMKEAILDVGKHIPNYRVPARVMGSATLSNFLTAPNITMFGAYHYGALRSYGEMIRDLINPAKVKEVEPNTFETQTETQRNWTRAKTLDKLAMMGLLALVVYPMLDEVAKKITKNKNTKVGRAGAITVPYNIYKFSKGQMNLVQVLTGIVTPAVGTETAAQVALNRDFFTGNEVYHSQDIINNPKQAASDVGNYIAKNIAPVQAGQKLAEGKISPKDFALSLFRVSSPKNSPAEQEIKSLIYDKKPTLEGQVKSLYLNGETEKANSIIGQYNADLYRNVVQAIKDNGYQITDEAGLDGALSSYYIKPPTDEQLGKYQQKQNTPFLEQLLNK